MKKNGDTMSENIQVSIIALELLEVNFKLTEPRTKEEDREKTSLNISYVINDDQIIEFTVSFVFHEADINIEGTYLFTVQINNVDELEEFINKGQEKLIYPVYAKISSLISYFTDQTRGFPLIVPPEIWMGDEKNDGKE